jgi:uncharacterized protein (TIGR02246 family)
MRTLAAAVLSLTLLPAALSAQATRGPGAAAHPGLDAIYTTFSKAYETLEPAAVANLYTEDALYLAPGGDILRSRKAILDNFTGFFGSVREAGSTLRIRFEIVDRQVSESLATDVGYFILTRSTKDGRDSTNRGKFVVVAKKQADGIWRFHVDSYSGVEEPGSQ